MPGRGGLWALGEIRRHRPRTGLVVLTSDGRVATQRAAREAGADAFVRKDGPVEDVVEAVRRVFGAPRQPQGRHPILNP